MSASIRPGGLATRTLSLVLVLGLVLVGFGCVTVETQSFRALRSDNVESAEIAVDADFETYDRLLADEMGIFFPSASAVSPEDIQRMRQIFRRAFLSELQGYRIVDRAGPTTMRVQASLIDLRNAQSSEIPQLRRDISRIAASGSLVFLMEMRDSVTNRVLARAGDSASSPVIADGAGTRTDWAGIEAAARRWAMLFRAWLDENLMVGGTAS